MSGLLNMGPQDEALLALGLGLLNSKGSFGNALGQAGMQSLGVLNQAKEREQLAKQRAAQEQMQQMQVQQMQQKLAEQQKADAFRASLKGPQQQNVANALGGGGGPTMANAAKLGPSDPNAEMMFGAMQAGLMNPLDYIKAQQKDTTPIKLGAGDSLLDPKTFKPLATNPKEQTDPADWRLYQLSGAQSRGVPFDEWHRANKKAGASSVSVNTGQKGYENESKLRNDFKSEPIYKDYQDMLSAHKQIKAGIKADNPVGDLATATKIMKLLDPSSVVRESELGMAMAASGRMDRLKNFIDLQVNGRKLTPTQRQEFGALADELMEAAGQAYNVKRAEYAGFGKRYGLDEGVLGGGYTKPPASDGLPPMSAIDAEIERRKKGK
jgi:hypothetical protein